MLQMLAQFFSVDPVTTIIKVYLEYIQHVINFSKSETRYTDR